MYVRPIVLKSYDLAEGVFMDSGDCYTCTASIHQRPETGRQTFKIQFDAKHAATDNHCSDNHQRLHISFDHNVEYVSSNGSAQNKSGTEIVIDYAYWNNPKDNIGLGDLEVRRPDDPMAQDLTITGCYLEDLAKKY